MRTKFIYFFASFMVLSNAHSAEVKKFNTLWDEIYQKSYDKKSSELERETFELSLKRADRHWLPRVYLGGQWFSTNDPTQVFFTNLGQRSIQQADFIPSDLNYPGRKNFKTATLGLDLPIYEGGMKSTQSSMLKSLVKASELEIKARKSEEYAEFSRQYGGLIIYTENEKYLSDLKSKLGSIIASYQVGSQSNPVGYSGLLGLKGVINRINGALYEVELKIQNAKFWINSKIEKNEDWAPDTTIKLGEFLKQNLSQSAHQSYSSMLLAQEIKTSTLDDVKEMEKARHLPKIGFFAQNNMYSGNRDTQNAQAFGLYLMWDIFNSDSYGRVGEANAKALAAQAKIESGKQTEKIMWDQMNSSKITLEKSIELLSNSDVLLKEQTVNAMKLFKSGMISALQLAEVLNRRVDLIENKIKVESQYLEVYSRIYQLNN